MASLTMQDAGYRYPTGAVAALSSLDLRVRAGELVLLTGPTGCGKSTLLRLAAGLLQRHGQGQVQGTVDVDGVDPGLAAPSERVGLLGFVSQEPGAQLVAGTIQDELAFAPESAGWPAERIGERVDQLIRLLGLPEGLRQTRQLSGGQQQRLVVGAAVAAGAGVLLLDEPLAQLDPGASKRLMEGLRGMADRGTAVLIVEHRVAQVAPYADRVVRLGEQPGPRSLEAVPPIQVGERLLRALDLRWAWGLDGVSLDLHRGERVALMGVNGAGKSTLLRALAGELGAGGVEVQGRLVDVPQDPDLALFCDSVDEEVLTGPRELGLDPEAASAALRALRLEPLRQKPPQSLSRGQRMRVAIAAAAACRPSVLVLDEPTAGQDRQNIDACFDALCELIDGALLFATHDLDLTLRYGTRVLLMEEGRVVLVGDPTALADELGRRLG